MRPGDPTEVTGNTPPTIDRYTIEAPIGRGGFGNVFRARHMHTKQLVALKVLRSSAIRSGHTAAHLVREAQIMASVRHRNIVQVMDAGIVDDTAFVAMELVEGTTLAERVDTAGPLPIGVVLDLAHQLLGALEAAHRAGVVHRDIKPQNLVVLADGTLKVLDFGISKASFVAVSATSDERWAGTPGYMAPEQYGSGDVDARADIYAAGATLFRMLCGRRPFSEDHFATLMTRVLSERAPLVSTFRPDAPAALVMAVDRALSRDRDARFPSAAAFAAALGVLPTATPGYPSMGEAPTLLAPSGDAGTTRSSPAPSDARNVHHAPIRSLPPTRKSNLPLLLGLGALALVGSVAVSGGWALSRARAVAHLPDAGSPPLATSTAGTAIASATATATAIDAPTLASTTPSPAVRPSGKVVTPTRSLDAGGGNAIPGRMQVGQACDSVADCGGRPARCDNHTCTCPGGATQRVCGGYCVPVNDDACTACDTPCADDQHCVYFWGANMASPAGVCRACDPKNGGAHCGPAHQCTKLDLDPANCGKCGNACGANAECRYGQCIAISPLHGPCQKSDDCARNAEGWRQECRAGRCECKAANPERAGACERAP